MNTLARCPEKAELVNDSKQQPGTISTSYNDGARNTWLDDDVVLNTTLSSSELSSEYIFVDECNTREKSPGEIDEEEPSSLKKASELKSRLEAEDHSDNVPLPRTEPSIDDLGSALEWRSPLLDGRLEKDSFTDINIPCEAGSSEGSSSPIIPRSASTSRKSQPENSNWWRRPFTIGGNPTSKKPRSLKPSGTRLHLVKKVGVFKLLDDYVLNAICENLYFRVYPKNRYVCREDKPVQHMLFIIEGRLECSEEDGTVGTIEDFCGCELLLWHSQRMGGQQTSNAIQSGKYPLSKRAVKCTTNVEAFAFDSDALLSIMTQFQDVFLSPRVQMAMRYFSAHWRSWAATRIQTAWRFWKERRPSCPGRPDSSMGQNPPGDEAATEEAGLELPKSGSVAVSHQETQLEEPSVDAAGFNSTGLDEFDDASLIKYMGEQNGTHHLPTNIWREWMKKSLAWLPNKDPMTLESVPLPLKAFTHIQLRDAGAAAFKDNSNMGPGGFGSTIYRGMLPSSGIPLPMEVKRLYSFWPHTKGLKEFTAEAFAISQLKHDNLLPVRIGYFDFKVKKEFLLLSELMPNGNLDSALFEQGENGAPACLSWPQRFNIVTGIAGALEYLHEEHLAIIHGNVKASNVLLDEEWTAKLADVGLARLAHKHSTWSPAVVTLLKNHAYMAPEGLTSRELSYTEKADVFAFGSVALEVACGRRAISDSVPPEEKVLADWVKTSLRGGNFLDLVDKRLGEYYDAHFMEVLLMVGLVCSHPDPLARPSMRDVVRMLAGDTSAPSIPSSERVQQSDVVQKSVSSNGLDCNIEEMAAVFDGIPRRFSYEQLSAATNGFSMKSKLGQGGFGSVFEGVLLGAASNIQVAVKKMNLESSQGQGVKEFMAEVTVISRLRHRNLIELLGWCENAANKEYLLVYELMRNGSLDDVLFATEASCTLSWSQRLGILKGTAAALEYLHQGLRQQIIHRDIKCANILLDEDWNAHLGDFGLARTVDHQRGAATTRVAGTFGYIAPEVLTDGNFTAKSDVFGFGAVVLEVACGQRVWSGYPQRMGVVDWVWHCVAKGKLLSAVDPRLEDYDGRWMEVLLKVGLLCTNPNPMARPSMRQVVMVLAGDVEVPSIPPSKPIAVFTSFPGPLSTLDSSRGNSESTYELTVSSAPASKTTFYSSSMEIQFPKKTVDIAWPPNSIASIIQDFGKQRAL